MLCPADRRSSLGFDSEEVKIAIALPAAAQATESGICLFLLQALATAATAGFLRTHATSVTTQGCSVPSKWKRFEA